MPRDLLVRLTWPKMIKPPPAWKPSPSVPSLPVSLPVHCLDLVTWWPAGCLPASTRIPAPGPPSAIELNSGTKVAYGQGTVYPSPTQVPCARCTELTLHKIEGPDILQHSIYSRSFVRALLQRNLNRTTWKELISTICLRLSYINTLMYDRPWLSVRNRYSTNSVYNCDTVLLWRNLNRSITQELILNNHLSIFASRFALLRQSLNCIILKELTLHNPLSIYVSPLASLRWTRTAPYYRSCYSTTNFVPTLVFPIRSGHSLVSCLFDNLAHQIFQRRIFVFVLIFFSSTSNLLQRIGGFPSLLNFGGFNFTC